MRMFIGLLLCGTLAALAQTAGEVGLCSMEGKVLNASTGEPVANAILALRGSVRGVYTASSDDKGQYSFAGIEAGQYTLSAERVGFVTANYGAKRESRPGKPLALVAAQNALGLDFKLTPTGGIAGRVLDADGEPLPGAWLTFLRQRYVNGRQQLSEADAYPDYPDVKVATLADDRGEYRTSGLAPGKYFVAVAVMERNETYKPLGKQLRALKTYYPSAIEEDRAEPVEVKAGRVTSSVNVTVRRAAEEWVRGRMDNLTALAPNSDAVLAILLKADGNEAGRAAVTTQTGEFEMHGIVPPGRYTLAILTGDRLRTALSSWQMVDVTGAPLAISVRPGSQVAGTVRVEDGGNARVNLRQLRVSLRPADWAYSLPEQNLPNQPVGPDGKFTLNNVFADRYAVNVSGLPAGVYIKSIRMGEADALENPLDLTKGASDPVEIVLSANVGKVEGSVKDDQDAPDAGATVALIPTGAKRREWPGWYRSATTDAQGKFTMAAVPPGDYKMFAWDDVEDTAWMDPKFLKAFEDKGKAVTVREGAAEAVELRAIPPVE